MTTKPQSQKSFCDLSAETIVFLAAAQGRLLENRKRSNVPVDPRSLENLKRLEMAGARLKPGSKPGLSHAVSHVVSHATTSQQGGSVMG
jgi:hypothetical protein